MSTETKLKYILRENKCLFVTPHILDLGLNSFNDFVHKSALDGRKVRQGYLDLRLSEILINKFAMNPDFQPTELRLKDDGGEYSFTLKDGGLLSREVLTKKISSKDFNELWPETKGKRVSKTRLSLPYQRYNAEIDIYRDNRDLVVAEVKVSDISEMSSVHPLGRDITRDLFYRNVNLAR